MALTAKTLARHELVGLEVAVTEASNPDLESVGGTVVTETTRTLGVEGADERVRHVPKDGTTFEFSLASGTVVGVEGARLVARPARRTETRGESAWR